MPHPALSGGLSAGTFSSWSSIRSPCGRTPRAFGISCGAATISTHWLSSNTTCEGRASSSTTSCSAVIFRRPGRTPSRDSASTTTPAPRVRGDEGSFRLPPEDDGAALEHSETPYGGHWCSCEGSSCRHPDQGRWSTENRADSTDSGQFLSACEPRILIAIHSLSV